MSAKCYDATRAIGACLAELAEALGERLEWRLLTAPGSPVAIPAFSALPGARMRTGG
jgi:hypothetical protein